MADTRGKSGGWGFGALASLLLLILAGCSGDADRPLKGETLEVVQKLPHDRSAYTQGLVFYGGNFLESAGLYGESTLRKVDVETGAVLERRELDDRFFAEGLEELNGRLYQLTWQEQTGLVWDADRLELIDQFQYTGQGWGLATDGEFLIVSDGSYRLRFIDPATFAVDRVLEVRDAGRVVFSLNELEWVDGELWANIYQEDNIARIDPVTGEVIGWVNVGGLLPFWAEMRGAEVANGIAYDEATDRLWVTGKNWPTVFEVRRP